MPLPYWNDWPHRLNFYCRQRFGSWFRHPETLTLPLAPLVPLNPLDQTLQDDPDLNARYKALLEQDPALMEGLLLFGEQVARESLAVLDVFMALERHWPDWKSGLLSHAEQPVWLDVGSKNGFYLPALRWQQRQCYPTPAATPWLEATELDAYRRYTNGHTRADYGNCIAQALGSAVYTVGDFLDQADNPVDVITLFYPFVFPYSVARWGLPRRTLQPQAMFIKAWRLLKPGGLLMTTHYGEEEAEQWKTFALSALPQEYPPVWLGPVALPPSYLPCRYTRMLSVCQR